MAKGITEKQEKFCVAYIKSGNATAAYRKAGYGKRMKPKSVNESASRMLKNVKIATRIRDLRAKVEERSVITLDTHLRDLKSLRDAAKRDKQFSAAISAEAYRGKASGCYSFRDDGGDLPPSGEPGEGEVTLDKARRVAFLLQAGVRITVTGSTAGST